mgnify:FL=1
MFHASLKSTSVRTGLRFTDKGIARSHDKTMTQNFAIFKCNDRWKVCVEDSKCIYYDSLKVAMACAYDYANRLTDNLAATDGVEMK